MNVEPSKRYKADDIRQHPWYQQYNRNAEFTDNLINEDIEISYKILNQLEQFKFDTVDAERQIKANKHNHITTTYYLLLKKYEKNKKKRQVKRVEADLFLEDQNQTQPPLYPQNLSVSQKVKGDYFQNSTLNQTLPVSSRGPEVVPINSKNKTDSFDFAATKRTYDVNPNATKHHIYMDTSKAEQQAGINVSYDNSFSAIKRDIQKTVGDSKTKVEDSKNATSAQIKTDNDDKPPNKPNEAIMISDTIKVKDNTSYKSNQNERVNMNNTMPEQYDGISNSILKKYSISKNKDYSVDEEQAKKNSDRLNFNVSKDAPSSAKHYSSKAQSNDMSSVSPNTISYDTSTQEKRHVANFSYSSRPKTTHYLTTNNTLAQSTRKANQVNSFMTQSMDKSNINRKNEQRIKKSLDKYDQTSIPSATSQYKKYTTQDGSASSARYSRASQNQNKHKESNMTTLTTEDFVENQSIEQVQAMKTYRGPFSVS